MSLDKPAFPCVEITEVTRNEKASIAELEEILNGPDQKVEIMPNGELKTKMIKKYPGITIREYAAIHLKVPMSGNAELDKMIRLSRRLDWSTSESTSVSDEWVNVCHEPSGEAGK